MESYPTRDLGSRVGQKIHRCTKGFNVRLYSCPMPSTTMAYFKNPPHILDYDGATRTSRPKTIWPAGTLTPLHPHWRSSMKNKVPSLFIPTFEGTAYYHVPSTRLQRRRLWSLVGWSNRRILQTSEPGRCQGRFLDATFRAGAFKRRQSFRSQVRRPFSPGSATM